MPQAKTCILRSTNTSFKLLEMYLLQLQTAGLLELQSKPKRYTTTSAGEKFVETWAYLRTLLYPEQAPRTKNGKFTLYGNHLNPLLLKQQAN